jgi:hypothetical protein
MTNQGNQEKIAIISGPSREELFDALRLRHEDRQVCFTIESPNSKICTKEIFNVKVDGIAIEDGSGNNWLLSLSNPRDCHKAPKITTAMPPKFEVYFNTTRRKGMIL